MTTGERIREWEMQESQAMLRDAYNSPDSTVEDFERLKEEIKEQQDTIERHLLARKQEDPPSMQYGLRREAMLGYGAPIPAVLPDGCFYVFSGGIPVACGVRIGFWAVLNVHVDATSQGEKSIGLTMKESVRLPKMGLVIEALDVQCFEMTERLWNSLRGVKTLKRAGPAVLARPATVSGVMSVKAMEPRPGKARGTVYRPPISCAQHSFGMLGLAAASPDAGGFSGGLVVQRCGSTEAGVGMWIGCYNQGMGEKQHNVFVDFSVLYEFVKKADTPQAARFEAALDAIWLGKRPVKVNNLKLGLQGESLLDHEVPGHQWINHDDLYDIDVGDFEKVQYPEGEMYVNESGQYFWAHDYDDLTMALDNDHYGYENDYTALQEHEEREQQRIEDRKHRFRRDRSSSDDEYSFHDVYTGP